MSIALGLAQADESSSPPLRLDPVVVVADKAERPLRDVAARVTVVDREMLDATGSTSLDDVFRYVPGIDAAGGGTRFGSEGVIIRGIGGNRVAVELDGAPLSSQFAVGNFANATRDLIDIGFVQRVEVLHGPASALYGSSAVGGVMAVQTPTPRDLVGQSDRGVSIAQSFRSDDDSTHTLASVAGAGERLGLAGMASVRRGHERDAAAASGEPDRQDYDRRSGYAGLTFDGDRGGRLRTGFYTHDAEVDTNIESVLGTGRFGSTTRLEGRDEYELDLFTAEYAFGAVTDWLDAGLVRGFYETVDIRQDTLDERQAAERPTRIERRFDYAQDLRGLETTVTRQFRSGPVAHRLAAGLEWTRSEVRESRDGSELGLDDGVFSKTVLGESFPVRDFPSTETDEYGAFIQDQITHGRLTWIAALRYDRLELDPRPDAIYREDNPATEPVALSEDELSPKLGLIARLTPATDIYLQYAHGFRAPSFEEVNVGLDIPLFNIRAVPNPELRPETSDGIEAGLRWRGERAKLDLNVFHTRYRDFIESKVRLGVDPDSGRILFQSLNIGSARIYGVEASGHWWLDEWIEGLALQASAFWARGDNRSTDEPLNSVGPPQAVLGASWTSRDGRTDAALLGTFTARWSRLDETSGELFEPPGHAVFDVYASRRWGRGLQLRLGIRNLLDRTYWRWADVRGFAPDDPVLGVLSQPGRNAYLQLRWDI